MDALSEQVNALKIDRVATSFKPRQVTYEQATGKVFVTGELTTQRPNAKAETKNRTYEFLLAIYNHRPRLDSIDVYADSNPARPLNCMSHCDKLGTTTPRPARRCWMVGDDGQH